MSDTVLKVCYKTKYLGHYITDDLSDDRDIYLQCRAIYAQAKTLIRKFGMCSVPVKTSLFKTYRTPMYTAHLWCHYRRSSMQKLNVAYNDGMKLLLKVPRWSSASQLFFSVGVPTCPAVRHNLMNKCMCRMSDSVNSIIFTLTNTAQSSVRFFSKIWSLWCLSLYVNLSREYLGICILFFVSVVLL